MFVTPLQWGRDFITLHLRTPPHSRALRWIKEGGRAPNMAHIRQSRLDYDLGFQIKMCQNFQVVPPLLRSGRVGHLVGQLPTLIRSGQA